MRLFPVFIAIFLPLAASSQGKWNGEINLDAGSNFNFSPANQQTHNLGDISGRVGYNTDKFSFDLSGSGAYHHVQVGQTGRDYLNDTTGVSESSIKKVDSSVKQKTNINAGAMANFCWKPNRYDTFKAYYIFSYNKNTPNTYTFSSQDIGNNRVDYSISVEKTNDVNYIHQAGINYKHIFDKPGRTIYADLGLVSRHSSSSSDWTTGDGEGEKPDPEMDIPTIVQKIKEGLTDSLRYKIEPYSDNNDFSASVIFSEPEFAGAKNLTMDFSAGLRLNRLEDHSRASTLVNGEWRDSTSYRENFSFHTITFSPTVRVRYSVGIYKLDLSYSPEYYAQKLDSDGQVGDIDKGAVAHLVHMTNTFDPWKGHQFVLGLHRSESRPDYLQICWFLRDGQYSNEKYRGNPDLKNSIKTRTNFSYTYNYKRFTMSLANTYTYEPRKVAKTYDYEIINNQECRVYTWINGGSSHEINNRLTLSWESEHFKANLSGQYTFYRGFSHNGDETRSSEFSFSADAEYNLKTWTFSLNGSYQSEIKRNYVSMTAIPDCQARITKSFGKHIEVYLEGRAILDRGISIITESEDKTERREEKISYHNRLFVMGFSYSF